jgi:hypothetical protein
MVNISLTLYTKVFFGSFLKSPTQMGSLSINNSVTNISRLGTFNVGRMWPKVYTVRSAIAILNSQMLKVLSGESYKEW